MLQSFKKNIAHNSYFDGHGPTEQLQESGKLTISNLLRSFIANTLFVPLCLT